MSIENYKKDIIRELEYYWKMKDKANEDFEVWNDKSKYSGSFIQERRAEADTDSVLVAGTANVTMKNNGDACISNQGGNVIVNGNIAKINTNCEVKGGVNATSIIQSSSYMLALDFAPCIPMNTAMQALNESVNDEDNLQQYVNNEVNYINNE